MPEGKGIGWLKKEGMGLTKKHICIPYGHGQQCCKGQGKGMWGGRRWKDGDEMEDICNSTIFKKWNKKYTLILFAANIET